MRWLIIWEPPAAREFDRLGREVQDRIEAELTNLATGKPAALTRVKAGMPGELRLRVGKYRLRLLLDHAIQTVFVERVGLRDHICD